MKMHELMYLIKKPFRIINALVNSAQTPEEFLQKGEAPPSISKVKNFLKKHDIRQIIKLQLFNNKSNLFSHDGFHGFILEVKLVNIHKEILEQLFSYGYPDNTTMSILLKHDASGNCCYYITIASKLAKKSSDIRIQRQLLVTIAKKMLTYLKEHNMGGKILRPKHLLKSINEIIHRTDVASYENDKFIYEQLIPSINNDIDNNGVLSIEDSKLKVFYTKQYPNIYEDSENTYLDKFINHIKAAEVAFYYSININLNGTDFTNQQKVYEFNTTLVLQDQTDGNQLEQYIQNYFRSELNWFIYLNRLSSFQQFIECIPFQFDNSSAERLKNSSITQRFPASRLVQLFPMESNNEI